MYEKFYVHKKFLRTRNCRLRFIKNLLPEKRNENIKTKQPRFQLRLKKQKACQGSDITVKIIKENTGIITYFIYNNFNN